MKKTLITVDENLGHNKVMIEMSNYMIKKLIFIPKEINLSLWNNQYRFLVIYKSYRLGVVLNHSCLTKCLKDAKYTNTLIEYMAEEINYKYREIEKNVKEMPKLSKPEINKTY